MNKEEFNTYLDNLLVQAQIESEMGEFTNSINKIISETCFYENKQAFLFISIENADRPEAETFVSYVAKGDGAEMLRTAITLFLKQLKEESADNE